MFDSILLVYYHPIIFDLAESFKKHSLFRNVEIAVSGPLKDNYGDQNRVLEECRRRGFVGLPLPAALLNIKNKKYTVVGLDGVFQQDNLVIDVCQNLKIPYLCINGYPHNIDEPSQNILSFSWFLPQIQYKMMYGNEGAIKEVDWKNIAEKGHGGTEKNICVFYPEMNDVKKIPLNNGIDRSGAISLIHRFEECNKWSYDAFVKSGNGTANYTSLTKDEIYEKLNKSKYLLHLKHGDCPGIAVLEAMILGCVPIVMESFVLSSFNQDLLIDSYSAFICEDLDEVRWLLEEDDPILSSDGNDLFTMTRHHAWKLTSFHRQKRKLYKFFERCINGKY